MQSEINLFSHGPNSYVDELESRIDALQSDLTEMTQLAKSLQILLTPSDHPSPVSNDSGCNISEASPSEFKENKVLETWNNFKSKLPENLISSKEFIYLNQCISEIPELERPKVPPKKLNSKHNSGKPTQNQQTTPQKKTISNHSIYENFQRQVTITPNKLSKSYTSANFASGSQNSSKNSSLNSSVLSERSLHDVSFNSDKSNVSKKSSNSSYRPKSPKSPRKYQYMHRDKTFTRSIQNLGNSNLNSRPVLPMSYTSSNLYEQFNSPLPTSSKSQLQNLQKRRSYDNRTKVIYKIQDSEKFTTSEINTCIFKPAHHITLLDFKKVFKPEGRFRFYFLNKNNFRHEIEEIARSKSAALELKQPKQQNRGSNKKLNQLSQSNTSLAQGNSSQDTSLENLNVSFDICLEQNLNNRTLVEQDLEKLPFVEKPKHKLRLDMGYQKVIICLAVRD